MRSFLILEDGTIFSGKSGDREIEGITAEVVFNTSMTGYTEVLTDPSYAGQAVCMTYPLIGNYGVSSEDMQSGRIWPSFFIVRELSRTMSNFRAEYRIRDFLNKYEVPWIEGIDTRKLVKILREKGTMNGILTTDPDFNLDYLLPEIQSFDMGDVVKRVSTKEKYQVFNEESDAKENFKIALLDVGTKYNIADSLAERGARVTVFPSDTKAEDILSMKPDGIMISNGPGDPKTCEGVIEELKILSRSGIPIFAICLGHQLMALAHGMDTHKMKYGHRGANHPVKNMETGKVYISSQNHGYVVDFKDSDKEIAEPLFINVNDGTIEGLKYKNEPIFTVQFHPEACAGPKDTGFLFDRFLKLVGGTAR